MVEKVNQNQAARQVRTLPDTFGSPERMDRRGAICYPCAMPLVLYNSASRRKEPFEPIDAERVRMYVCGPTVYDRAHIGNGRAFVVFDVLYRLLRDIYGKDHVRYVRNITDVEDKINAAAARQWRADRGADGAHDRRFSRRHGGARRTAPRYRAARHRAHPADDRDDRAADRLRPRLCRRRPCAVRGRLRPRLRAALAAAAATR